MRENTRWEVDDPISTPTLRTTISSSSTSERPVEEKKMRPPSSSLIPVSKKLIDGGATGSVCCLSRRERGGVRGYDLSIEPYPPHPDPLPCGERERTEL